MDIFIHMDIRKLDVDYEAALDEYIKRCSPFCKVNIKMYKSFLKMDLRKNSVKVIVVSGINNMLTSEGLADMIQDYNLHGHSCIEFIVPSNGDAESIGINDFINSSINIMKFETLNLSSFSLGGQLTSVVLTEQIYRAYTILNNITYHK